VVNSAIDTLLLSVVASEFPSLSDWLHHTTVHHGPQRHKPRNGKAGGLARQEERWGFRMSSRRECGREIAGDE
jgi:hypothetical protein